MRRFLARHASAQGYSAFPDFAAYTLTIAKGHFIGGFGRIVSLDAAALTTRIDDALELINAEPGIIEHMNSDHADAISSTRQNWPAARQASGAWWASTRPAAICCIALNAARIDFPEPVRTPVKPAWRWLHW